MSKGNNNTYGGKKMNFPFQQSLLQINGLIQAATAAGATEATLQLVLAAIQNGQDYEAKLVRDSDTPSVTWLEVRLFNTTTGTFDPPIYYPAGSNTPGSPVLPIVYIDPTTLLATIASNTTGLALETTLTALSAKFNSLGQKISAASHPVVLSTEQEAILVAIDAVLDTIKLDTANISNDQATETTLAATNTLLTTIDTVLNNILSTTTILSVPITTLPVSNLRVVAAGPASVAAGKRRVSFFNAGITNTTVAGAILKAGESVTFSADGLRDTLAAIAYDANTSELLISTVG